MNPALITVIENQDTNLGEGSKSRIRPPNMEDEALLCFKSWREYAGDFKDIPIYAICPSKRVPHKSTILKMVNLGVTYIGHYLPETDGFTCGYWNVPIACHFLEHELTEDFLIHTDLDMMVVKPLVEELFYCEKDVLAKIGTITKCRTIDPSLEINFETCFINSWRDNSFYHIWEKELKIAQLEFANEGIFKDTETFRYSEIEEHVIDIMYKDDKYNIQPIHNYQIGSWYPAEDIPDISKVYFHHDHLYEPKRAKALESYLRRWLNYAKSQ